MVADGAGIDRGARSRTQRGHMALPARNIASTVGATSEELPQVVARLIADRIVRADYAEAVLAELRSRPTPEHPMG